MILYILTLCKHMIFLCADQKFGKIWLFFGCRQRNLDLYRQEKKEMLEVGVLDKVFLALSREPGFKKVLIYMLFYRSKKKRFVERFKYYS